MKYKSTKAKTIFGINGYLFRLYSGLFLVASMLGARTLVQLSVTGEASNTPTATSSIAPSERTAPLFELAETVEKVEVNIGELIEEEASRFLTGYDGDISVSVRAIDDSFTASVAGNEVFDAASLYKALAAYVVLQRVDAGELSLKQTTSAGMDLERCIEQAIKVSDNPCGIILQRLAQPSDIDAILTAWGLPNTSLSGVYPQTSADDQVQLFTDIFSGKRLSQASKTLLLNALGSQQILNRTPQYSDAKTYVKTGDLGSVVNVTSVVDNGLAPYAISVLSDNWSHPDKAYVIMQLQELIHKVILENA